MEFKVLINALADNDGYWTTEKWINFPASPEYILEVTGINVYKDPLQVAMVTIGDYELDSFATDEVWYGQLDLIAKRLQDVRDNVIIKELPLLVSYFFGGSLMDMLENINDFRRYETQSYNNLVIQFMNLKDGPSYVAPRMREYVDKEAYASVLEASGNFLLTENGIFYRRAKSQVA